MVGKDTGKTGQSAVLSLRKLRGKVKITSLFYKITTLYVKITTLFDKITTLFDTFSRPVLKSACSDIVGDITQSVVTRRPEQLPFSCLSVNICKKVWWLSKKSLSLHRQDESFDYPVHIPYECRVEQDRTDTTPF